MDEDGFGLGMWIHLRRSNFNKGRLSRERFAELNGLNFIWDIHEHKFSQAYYSLKVFYDTNKHSGVPSTYIDGNNFKLGAWAGKLKIRLHKLEKEKLALLKAVEFSGNPIFKNEFDRKIELVEEFHKQFGHSKIPVDFICSDGTPLGRWTASRRRNHGSSMDTFTEDQKVRLNKVDFKLTSRMEEKWLVGLFYLKKYFSEKGSKIVPVSYKTVDGFALGSWCSTKRKERKNGTLTIDRETELNELGFVWDYRNTTLASKK